MNPTARLATIFRTPGVSRSDAADVMVRPRATRVRRWTGTRSALATRARLAVALTATALALLLLSSAPALATTGHSFAGQLGAPGNEAGQLAPGGPSGIAVDQSSGDVLVSDPGHTNSDGVTPEPRIERFDASGTYVSSFSIDAASFGSPGALALDPTGSGSLYVAATELSTGAGTVLKYSEAGAFDYALDTSASTTSINAGAGIALDPTDGTVYATATDTSTGAPVIDSFNASTGAFVASFDGTNGGGGFICPSALAIDSAHRLYVLDQACFGAGTVSEDLDRRRLRPGRR